MGLDPSRHHRLPLIAAVAFLWLTIALWALTILTGG
jgi:hypothetical protein